MSFILNQDSRHTHRGLKAALITSRLPVCKVFKHTHHFGIILNSTGYKFAFGCYRSKAKTVLVSVFYIGLSLSTVYTFQNGCYYSQELHSSTDVLLVLLSYFIEQFIVRFFCPLRISRHSYIAPSKCFVKHCLR